MNKKKEDGMNFFTKDANFFLLWCFSSSKFWKEKDIITINDISPLSSYSRKKVLEFLKSRLDLDDILFPKIYRYSDTPIEEFTLKADDNRLKSYSDIDKNKLLASLKKFNKDNFNIDDLLLLASYRESILDYVYFEKEITNKEAELLNKQIDKYIDDFLDNELFVLDKNYYNFETNKQFFVNKIRKMNALEKYGENFIISNVDEDTREPIGDDAILFFHTLYALQKLGYIGVLKIWFETSGSFTRPAYYANIVLFNEFIEEINNSYRKENPSMIFEKFDAKKGLLKFAGKEIELSKKGKETDAVLLLTTLVKAGIGEWKHNDEILEDWGYHDEDQERTPKNKVYFAGRAINNAIALKTKIDDFVECNTTKARINPKYRKVDE
jgi:hypothetical protein